MEMLITIAFLLLVLLVVMVRNPQWWIGVLVILTFTSFPAFVPQQLQAGGFGVYLHEIPMLLGALYLLLFRPANRKTDLCAVGIATITALGAAYGFWRGNELAPIANDSRGLIAMAISLFIVGRIAWAPEAQIALRSIKITLWVSLAFVFMGAWGIVELSGRSEDASLTGAAFHDATEVTRVLGQTNRLAAVVLAVCVALWAIRPDLVRTSISYLVPALGITVIGFSRNALILVAITLLLAPVFYRGSGGLDSNYRQRGAWLRVASIGFALVGIYIGLGLVLYATAGVPGFEYLRLVYSAYSNRVLDGLTTTARLYDQSALYRLAEIKWLKRSIDGNEFFGSGLGHLYKPFSGDESAPASRAYYAHNFYWWAIAKVGWIGLVGYMSIFATALVNALVGTGRFPLRAAAGAAIVGHLVTISVAPAPEDVFGAPVLGALIGIALLCMPASCSSTREAEQLDARKHY